MSLYSVLFRPHTFYTHFWGHSTGNISINCGEFNRGPQRRSGAGALTVWEKAEGTVLAQPGDEMAFGRASSSLPMPTRWFSRRLRLLIVGYRRRQKTVNINWNARSVSDWVWGEKTLTLGQPSIGRGRPKRLCCLHPWRSSRFNHEKPWPT